MCSRDACQFLRKKWIKLGPKNECEKKKRSKSGSTKSKIRESIASSGHKMILSYAGGGHGEEESKNCKGKSWQGTSLVAQWLRIRLPMQGTWVRALVRDDPICRGATKPVCHNYWACALEPESHNYWACVPQLLKPACLEPVLHNERSHHKEKPAHSNEE